MSYKKLIVPLLSFILYSCSDPVSQNQVIGEYIANHNVGKDILIINSNKTYIHIFINDKGNRYENKNIWNFEEINNNLGITFNSFSFRYRDDTQHSGYWYVEVEQDIFETIKLCFDPDLYYCYIKIKGVIKPKKPNQWGQNQ